MPRPRTALPTLLAGALLALVPAAAQTTLDVSVTTDAGARIAVIPGSSVAYDVVGELGDADNEGLAFIAFDLVFDGGDLTPVTNPTSAPMSNFAAPAGFGNPAGFGGTLVGGDLVQVGGGQNTINNVFAPEPNGTVITDVAAPGSPVVLAAGTLVAPTTPGVYTLSATNVLANVIRSGEVGFPFWAVDAAEIGAIGDLVIEVGTWVDVGFALAGTGGLEPALSGAGTLVAGTPITLTLADAQPSSTAALFLGIAAINAPFKGGTLVPAPTLLVSGLPTNAGGGLVLSATWPAGIPGGVTLYYQFWISDPGGPKGLSASNGLAGTTPL